MASRVPSYLKKNRFHIFNFQVRIPTQVKSHRYRSRLFRISLHTRDRKVALKRARYYSIIMDILEEKFGYSPELYDQAIKLLKAYQEITDWQEVELFLNGLDDHENAILDYTKNDIRVP